MGGKAAAAFAVLGTVLCLAAGCMIADTPEDECIVKKKAASDVQAETVASGDGLTIASQVQAEKFYECNFNKGMAEIQVRADVTVPDSEGFKIRKAKPYMFGQEDIDGWIRILAQGNSLWRNSGTDSDVSREEAEEWLEILTQELEKVQAELPSSMEKAQEIEERISELTWGIETCRDSLDNGWCADEIVKETVEWKLTDPEDTEESGTAVYDEETEAAVKGEIQEDGENTEESADGERENQYVSQGLYGMVDIRNTFAPWADEGTSTYICSIQNTSIPGYLDSYFNFKRRYRSDYGRIYEESEKQDVDTKVSRKEMRKAADALVEQLGLTDMVFAKAEPLYVWGVDTSLYGSHFLNKSKAWSFSYTRKVDDALLNCVPNVLMCSENLLYFVNMMYSGNYIDEETQNELYTQCDGRQVDWEQESFTIVFDDEGLVELNWHNPCTVENVSNENAFLLPFSEITQIFERSLPEQMLFEIFYKAGIPVKAEITEVKLGYMRFCENGNTEEAQLIPVWDFTGTIDSLNAEELGMEDLWLEEYFGRNDSLLTINATDGTIISRGKGY